ncbi:MAG: signal recognition particle receptor subunit alpha, partial [Candidatus Competibacteraceae bacterium]|nr:signal recognition particle receptor subunit alpha [Candidatus Competibacteraceae bacterium]
MSLFERLKTRLAKTRSSLLGGLGDLFRGRKIDEELLEELETRLLLADVGVDATRTIIDSLTQQAERKELADGQALIGAL